MTSPIRLDQPVNLKDAVVLAVEPSTLGMSILAQMLSGFGARRLFKADSYNEARNYVEGNAIDLIITEATLGEDGPDGFDFTHWLRHSDLEPNAYTPVIVISAHTASDAVAKGRDCGANFFIQKPLSPTTLLERILWIARQKRAHVSCDAYMGPDRRFKNNGPPVGTEGRRSKDLPMEIGDAIDANLSQSQIDSLIQPTRASR